MIRKMTDREHVIARPAMYIGAVNTTTMHDYILDESKNKMIYSEISYVPGFIKIINEIIDNCVDVAIKTNFESCTNINVKITNDYVEVSDNGTGIPIKKSGQHYLPELAWGHARAGSNFDDDDNRTQIGMNGVGSFATNCFSTKFIGKTDDGEQKYTITFKDNADSFTESLGKSTGKTGTVVKFYPDLAKFGLTSIDDIHKTVIKQRLINLSLSYPAITFKFNNRKVTVTTFKKYVQLFNDNFECYETDDYKFAVLPNDSDDFKQFSYVNGLKIPDGGTHIDVFTTSIVQGIRNKLIKRYKSIKPGDIKNKLMVISFIKNFPNPKFNSQAKEKITNSVSEMNTFFNKDGSIPYDNMVNKINKNSQMIDPITEVYRIKEEFKRRQELNSLKKPVKRIKSDKYRPSTENKKYLFLVEGDCLEENTLVTMADFSTKALKDVCIGEKVITGDLTACSIIAKTRLLKPTLSFKTRSGEIICGFKHKLNVYDIKAQKFLEIEAEHIAKDINNYKFVKSKVNSDSRACEVISNSEFRIETDDGVITYTDDDYFVISRSGNVMRIHGTDIVSGDLIVLTLDE